MSRIRTAVTGLVPIVLAASAAGCVSPDGETPDAQRADVRAMRDESLAQAYEKWPELRQKIETAPGYAVMNNGITKILIVGWARGYGITMDKAGKETFVDDFVVAVGPGIELASSRGVFVFNDPAALEAFKSGEWDFGADADAAFKFGDFGGAAIAADQGGAVDVYRVFQNGVGLHASLFWFHSGIDEDLEPGMQTPPAQ